MNILYIAEGYPHSKVHHNLAQSLVKWNKDVNLIVYSSLRRKFSLEDSKERFGVYNYTYLYDDVKMSHTAYKYNFWAKRDYKLKGLLSKVDIEKIDYIIASTLLSDGAVALEINKRFNIPFAVSVRGTDTNLYLKKLPHLWNIGRNIIKRTNKLFFISESTKVNFISSFIVRTIDKSSVLNKSAVIPNGIDDFFIENSFSKKNIEQAKKFLYIGDFSTNKNVVSLIKAFEILQNEYPDIELELVGGGTITKKSDENEILSRVSTNQSIKYLGKIYDRQELCERMRKNDVFAMVSHGETFGLVYIEALSQGLPIIYSRGQGVDGFFDEVAVGEKVNPKSIDEIYQAMKNLVENYSKYENIGDKLACFSWENNSRMIMDNIKTKL